MVRILVVDDEQLIADALYYYILRQSGELDAYRVYSARDALAMLRQASFDLLLTDISMPEMDGLALMSAARALWPDIRVIFLTGYDRFDYAYQALQREDVRFLLKTEGYEAVWSAIERDAQAIEQRKARAQPIPASAPSLSAALARHEFMRALLAPGAQGFADAESVRRALRAVALAMRENGAVTLLCGLHRGETGSLDYERMDAALGAWLGKAYACCFTLLGDAMCCVLQRHVEGEDAEFERVFLETQLAQLQSGVQQAYGWQLSLVYSLEPVEWGAVAALHARMSAYLARAGAAPALMGYERGAENPGGAARAVQRVCAYVKTHLGEELSLLTLSALVHFHPAYLSKLFHDQTGTRLMDYVSGLRLERAYTLLTETNIKIFEVARQCGFGSPKYFSRLFRQKYGKTPGEMRGIANM